MLIAVVGTPGSGKTYSLRNLPKDYLFVNSANREITWAPSQFSKENKNLINGAKSIEEVTNIIKKAAQSSKFKGIIIDDFQYVIAEQFMSRIKEKGFEKFNDLGASLYNFLKYDTLGSIRDKMHIIITWHTENKEEDVIGLKTQGKLIDQHFSPEGLLDVILHCMVDGDGNNYCLTKRVENRIARTPGFITGKTCPNDLNIFLEYYDKAKKGEISMPIEEYFNSKIENNE